VGLHPRPRWGSLQHSPDPLAGYEGLGKGKKNEREGQGTGRREGKKKSEWRKGTGGIEERGEEG